MHGSRVRCEFDIADDLWPANADKGQIGQVVQNLVINAAQAMPEGGVIAIKARNESLTGTDGGQLPPGNYVCITVADTGVGIKAENLARIFDPYFTTKQQGSGLGLATVYSIVRKHRGEIDVESELGKGTTFRVRLPALPGLDASAENVSVARDSAMRGRALFMDDEAPIRKLADAILRRLGFDVDLVADGDEAVASYRTAFERGEPYDIVIMDLTVPGGMGGREALEQLLAIDPGVKAIVSSGYSSDPVLANFRACGFRGVVSKPYELGEFSRAVRDVIGSSESRDRSAR
jgi:CheY-like chemotaxis protein